MKTYSHKLPASKHWKVLSTKFHKSSTKITMGACSSKIVILYSICCTPVGVLKMMQSRIESLGSAVDRSVLLLLLPD